MHSAMQLYARGFNLLSAFRFLLMSVIISMINYNIVLFELELNTIYKDDILMLAPLILSSASYMQVLLRMILQILLHSHFSAFS